MPTRPASGASQRRASTASGKPPRREALQVLRRFRLVFNAVKTHFRQVEKSAGIGGAQLWALSLVKATPGITVSALARAMDIHQTTASNLVKSLLAMALVTTQRNGADRRSTLLEATAAGARLLRKAPGPFTGVLPQALGRLDAATLRRLDADLAALLDVLDADKRAAKIPLAQM